jgi:hypothetical protein
MKKSAGRCVVTSGGVLCEMQLALKSDLKSFPFMCNNGEILFAEERIEIRKPEAKKTGALS